MGYDKKSFLAGLSAGTQLRGWASYQSESSRYSMDAPKIQPNPPLLSVIGNVLSGNYNAPTRQPHPPLIEVFSFEEV